MKKWFWNTTRPFFSTSVIFPAPWVSSTCSVLSLPSVSLLGVSSSLVFSSTSPRRVGAVTGVDAGTETGTGAELVKTSLRMTAKSDFPELVQPPIATTKAFFRLMGDGRRSGSLMLGVEESERRGSGVFLSSGALVFFSGELEGPCG